MPRFDYVMSLVLIIFEQKYVSVKDFLQGDLNREQDLMLVLVFCKISFPLSFLLFFGITSIQTSKSTYHLKTTMLQETSGLTKDLTGRAKPSGKTNQNATQWSSTYYRHDTCARPSLPSPANASISCSQLSNQRQLLLIFFKIDSCTAEFIDRGGRIFDELLHHQTTYIMRRKERTAVCAKSRRC